MTKWTPDQQTAISTRGKDMLVSASAGSGKTTVMIERISGIIANREATINEILVLTFTNESARDMKAKLAKRLGGADLTQASIGTFHKFCGDLVQTYFNVVGVPPSYTILDDNNAQILRHEILETLTSEQYANCPETIDAFCPAANTSAIKEIIISVSEFLNSRADAKDWLNETAFDGYNDDLSQNPAMRGIITHYNETGAHYMSKFDPCTDCFEWAAKLTKAKTYTDLHNIAASFDKLARIKTNASDEEKADKAAFNDILKKIKEQYHLTESQMKANQQADKTLVSQTIALVRLFRERYGAIKAANNYLDFSDLEKYALEILTDKQLNGEIKHRYKYIFVDEYQDTNPVQEQILTLLTQSGGTTVFAVGDVKQSIYGFRGTDSQNFTGRMANYSENETHSRVVQLNANFRSRPQILAFVNQVFEKIMNETTCGIDYKKTSLFNIAPENYKTIKDNVEIIIIGKGNAAAEAAVIAEKVTEMAVAGTKLNEIAVLARNRTHFDTLIEVLKQAGIPCITDANSNVKDLLEIALLNNMLLCCANSDPLAAALLMQSFIFNFSAEDVALLHLKKATPELQNRFETFQVFKKKYHSLCKTDTVAEVLSKFMAEYEVIDRLLVTPNGSRMVRNIYTFLDKIRNADFAQTVMQYLTLLQQGLPDIKIENFSESANCVRLMTIHSSKGLEFPVVFLFEAGAPFSSAEKRKLLMPDKTCGLCVYSTDPDEFTKHHSIARLGAITLADKAQTAEEMRLLYVALTRAKDKLIITGSTNNIAQFDSQTPAEDYEILCARSYLQMMKPAISGKDYINLLNTEDIKIISAPPARRVLAAKTDAAFVKSLQAELKKPYIYETAIHNPARISVSALVERSAETNLGINNNKVQRYRTTTHNTETDNKGGKDFGTEFHKAMQYNPSSNTLASKCETETNTLTKGMTVYKEFPFMHKTADTVIHGTIDLFAIAENRAIIADYKTTAASPAELIRRYKPQLSIYAAAIKSATGLDAELYIYSTHHGKLTKVD